MGRVVAQAETIGDLLLAAALQQIHERLPQPRRELYGTRLGRADQRSTDQRAKLRVEEVQQPLFAR
jgi:hypothetical protein